MFSKLAVSRRQLVAWLLAFIMIVCAVPAMAKDYGQGTVNADKVLLREKANTSCDYRDRLNKGAK